MVGDIPPKIVSRTVSVHPGWCGPGDGVLGMAGADFLMTTWQGGGNLPPHLGLARRLVEAGHRVRVLSEPTVEADARAVGCSFTPWPTGPSIASISRDTSVIKDWTVIGRIASGPRVAREVMFGPAGRFARDVLATLARHPADAVLADVTQLGALIGAERSGLPTVGLLSSIYTRPTPGHPVMGSGAMPATGPVGRLRDAVVPRAFLRLARLGLPQLNAVRAELGMAPMAQVLDPWDRCDRVLVMTSPTFDPPPAALPANVRYVGPGTDDPPWAAPWTPPWPIAERPFVLVALSSTYQGHDALLRRVVAALDAEPVHALVTLGPGLRAGEVTGTATVAVAASAPHAHLLPQTAVVLTHAGHGSVMKALAAGVPLVCIPHGRDQADNTARVLAAGAGIRLSRRAGPGAIRAAMRRVLDDPSYRANARRLAEVFADEARHGPDAVAEVLGVVRTAG